MQAVILMVAVSTLGQQGGDKPYVPPLSAATAARDSRFANTPLTPLPAYNRPADQSGFGWQDPQTPVPPRGLSGTGGGVRRATFGQSSSRQNPVERAQYDSTQNLSEQSDNGSTTGQPPWDDADSPPAGIGREPPPLSPAPTYLRPQATEASPAAGSTGGASNTGSPRVTTPSPLTPTYQPPTADFKPQPQQTIDVGASPIRSPQRDPGYSLPTSPRPARRENRATTSDIALPDIGKSAHTPLRPTANADRGTTMDRGLTQPNMPDPNLIPERSRLRPRSQSVGNPANDRFVNSTTTTASSTKSGINDEATTSPPGYPNSAPAAGQGGQSPFAAGSSQDYGRSRSDSSAAFSQQPRVPEGDLRAHGSNSYFMTLLALFASVGLNLYLGWIAWDTYNRYQDLVSDMRYTGSRRGRNDEDAEYSDPQLARSGAY